MEATFLSANPTLPHKRFLMKFSLHRRDRLFVNAKQGESGEKFTDENLLVLKMRIKNLKALETNIHQEMNLKEQEKLYVQDQGDVSESIELLRSYFIYNRQSVALGALALIAMSIPLSTSPIMENVVTVVKGLLAGCHVSIDISF